jgi:hypothetical protein
VLPLVEGRALVFVVLDCDVWVALVETGAVVVAVLPPSSRAQTTPPTSAAPTSTPRIPLMNVVPAFISLSVRASGLGALSLHLSQYYGRAAPNGASNVLRHPNPPSIVVSGSLARPPDVPASHAHAASTTMPP